MRYFVLTWTARRNSKRHSGIWYSLCADRLDAERKLRRYIRDRYPCYTVSIDTVSTLPA